MKICIDPGINCSGYFIPHSLTFGIFRGGTDFDVGTRIRQQLLELDQLLEHLGKGHEEITDLVIEGQEVYKGKSANANDLFKPAWMAGAFIACFPEAKVHIIRPKDWTGRVSKKHRHLALQEEPWIQQGLRDVQPESLAHNALDAVGLGLWAEKALFRRGK